MKDAKGHGSEARGSSGGAMARFLNDIERNFSKSAKDDSALRPLTLASAQARIDRQAAAALAQGGAKSAPVPIHPGAAGRAPLPPNGHEGNDFHRRIADVEKQKEIIAGRKQMEANAAEWDRRGQHGQAQAIRERLRMMP